MKSIGKRSNEFRKAKKSRSFLVILGIFLFVTACGGGGGDKENAPEPGVQNPETPGETAGKEDLVQELDEVLHEQFREDQDFDPENASYKDNLDILTEKLLTAAGDAVIPLDEIVLGRMARYILFSYDLESFSRFTVDGNAFSDSLVREESGELISLGGDPNIPRLAGTRTSSVLVPLLQGELPGADNQRRLEYYYQSDASNLYRAERILQSVYDDAISDMVMVRIAESMALSGLLAEARAIIDTQVYQSEYKGDGYRAFGNALLRYGRGDEALNAFRKSEIYHRKIIDLRDDVGIAPEDAENLQHLSTSFRNAGDIEAAEALVDFLVQSAENMTSISAMGRVIMAIRGIVDEHLESGRAAEALPMIETMYSLSLKTPPNDKDGVLYYRGKIFYLTEAAERYAAVGNFPKVLEIYNLVRDIRSGDSVTTEKTWFNMADWVEILFRIGEDDLAHALAVELPENHSSKVFKFVAAQAALDSGLDEALGIIVSHFDDPADRVEALTYFSTAKSSPFVAMALINNERFEEAEEALQQAAVWLEDVEVASDWNVLGRKIQKGYLKVGELFWMIGNDGRAAELLDLAESSLMEMTGILYRLRGMIQIAMAHVQWGAPAEGARLLDEAEALLASSGDLAPEDLADLMEILVETHLELGNRDLAEEIILRGYLFVVRDIFREGVLDSGLEHDTAAEEEALHLITIAEHLAGLGRSNEAVLILDEAKVVAEKIYKEDDRLDLLVSQHRHDIVSGYVRAGRTERALDVAEELPYVDRRYRAFYNMAYLIGERDDFPETETASVDTDGDGRPDFFHPLATEEEIEASGLVMDKDSDGDEIPDTEDLRPLYRDQ